MDDEMDEELSRMRLSSNQLTDETPTAFHRVVATQALIICKKLIGGFKAMARWLSDKACVVLCVVINQLCVVINQLTKKTKKQESTSESCGHDPSTGEKLYPSSGTGARQPQKEEVASVSTSSETPKKTEGATGLPLRKGSRVATTTASGETTLSIRREESGFDWFDLLFLGVGLTIVGGLLGYGINYACLSSRFGRFLFLISLNCIPMFVVSSSIFAWSLYLGMSTNGRRGFANVFIGWLVTTIIATIVWWYMLNDSLEKLEKDNDHFLRSLRKELRSIPNWRSVPTWADVD